MPRFDGLQVLKALRENHQTSGSPAIMGTTSNEERDLRKSYRPGVNSDIVKPVNFEQFLEAVRQPGFYWLLLNKRPQNKQ